jgi:hypothetical protein
MKTKRPPSLLFLGVAALSALALAACPGGSTTKPPPTPPPTGDGRLSVLVEIDQMEGTPPLQDTQTLGGTEVSLAGLYEPGGVHIEVRHDESNLPAAPAVREADLHALLTAFRSVPAPPDGRHVHILVVTADADFPDTLGLMFDFGNNNPNDIPREGCAIFASTIADLPGATAPEMLLTAAHELAHVFNLHHDDWEGDSFRRGSTIEGYSSAETVRWALSAQSRAHLRGHPDRLVHPGPGSLPFLTITPAHEDGHQGIPGGNYVVADPRNLDAARRAPGGVRAMAVRSSRERAVARDAHPLRLELDPPKTRYLVGEPVTLTVGLENTGSAPQEILDLLDPTFGFLNVEIQRPGSAVFEPFRPAVRAYTRGGTPRTLASGESVHAEVKLFFGAEGWTFEQAGEYVVRADYPADALVSNRRLKSPEVTLTIEEPASEMAQRASDLMRGTEQGLFLLFNGGDHLRKGRESLEKVAQEAGTTPFAPAAQLALGRSALEPTLAAPGVTTRPAARLDEAQRYLEPTLDSDLPALSRLWAQEALAEALVTNDQVSEAEAVRQRTIEVLGDEKTTSQELRKLRTPSRRPPRER